MHVMIDLETLGTRPDACIIQIGAVLFEPVSGGKILNGKGFNRHVLVQDGSGSIDHGTLCFWLTENSAAKMGHELSTVADPLAEVLQAFVEWPMEAHELSWEAITGMWAAPSDFDLPILKSAYAKLGMDVPWDRRVTRDARTCSQWSVAGQRSTGWVSSHTMPWTTRSVRPCRFRRPRDVTQMRYRVFGYDGRYQGPKEKRFVCYYYFITWEHIALGVSIHLTLPSIEIHLPFGFIRLGWTN